VRDPRSTRRAGSRLPRFPRLRQLARFYLSWLAACLALLAGPDRAEPQAGGNGWGSLRILGAEIQPGQSRRLSFLQAPSFVKMSLDIPVLVVHGRSPGPTLCLTAAVHGDEINGVEIARHVHAITRGARLSGALIALPIVNVDGFRRGERLLSDRRDLNRYFPGSEEGSSASRIAYHLFSAVLGKCHALVDLHTGSDSRSNLPQIRADLRDPATAALAEHFGIGIVLHGRGPKGSLRRAAVELGIPAITYEAGETLRFQSDEIARGVDGVRNVMRHLGMLIGESPPRENQRVYRSSRWVRAPAGGIFLTSQKLGTRIEVGDVLGTITDPITNEGITVVARDDGELIGMAVPQVVLPGFALFHLARREGPLLEPEIEPELEPERGEVVE
jgi:hypothetical protein